MLLLSWNVAGLSKTVQRIHDAGETSFAAESPGTKNNAAALEQFFERHQADIVCLQEHKIPCSQLKNRTEPRQCSTLQNYESFWACSSNSATMNFGVVTYCRRGTVARANTSPLQCPDLDSQGRCIMTDHGSFVIFNVYVPASGGLPLSFKMRFLRALSRAMQTQREQGKAVILLGDLNIALDSKDIYWKDRVLYIDSILESIGRQSAQEHPQWMKDIATHWSTIAAILETKEVVPTKTTNTHTGGQFDKYRLAVTVGDRRVYLGRHESTQDHCLYPFDFGESLYFDEELQELALAQEANVVRIHALAELMSRIVDVDWSEDTLREIASTATVHKNSPPRKWLRQLLQDGNMVDTFRYFYPTAEGRFTCWHQFTNRRYVNDGARIDAILVDGALVPFIRKGNVESLRCGDPRLNIEDPLGEQAALAAATANGQFQPVSFEGGGIKEVGREALDTQFGEAHTGMCYTAPSYSDHIAVSLLIDGEIVPHELKMEADPATRKAQPHKLQKSIAACFALAKNTSPGPRKTQFISRIPAVSQKPSIAKRAKSSKPVGKPNSILNHFRKLHKN